MVIQYTDVGGSGGISPRILNLDTRWRWVVSSTPRPLHPLGRNLNTHWMGGLMGPKIRSENCGEETHPALPGIEHRSSNQSPITTLTKLFWLLWYYISFAYKDPTGSTWINTDLPTDTTPMPMYNTNRDSIQQRCWTLGFYCNIIR
jgi:hypothetical protein